MELDRRTFVAGTASALAGLVTAGGIAQTQARANGAISLVPGMNVPEAWDYEADIVAIGAGAAGLTAAVEAPDHGLTCIVLESQAISGGNSIRCNGGISIPGSPLQAQMGIEDSPDKMYNDLTTWFACDYDDMYVRMLCDLNGSLLWDFLTGLGVEFKESGLVQSNAHSVPREHHTDTYVLNEALESSALKKGSQIEFETRAEHLVRDPQTGRILGVRASRADGSEVTYKAHKAVMLCNGGYARNAQMLNDNIFGEGAEKYKDLTYDAPGCDGSGILMGQEVGAATRHMSYLSMLTVQNPDGNLHDACAMYHQGAVLINLNGERFVNEAQGYTNVWTELDEQPNAVCYQVWDDAIAKACAENDSSYYSQAKIEATGLLLKADTLEELAEQMGVPEDTFVSTMKKYNDDVNSSGVDSVFGREHTAGTGATPPALQQAPFYAFKTMSVICCTYGGLKRWHGDGLQAEDVFGSVIPGLYLAGAISDFCNQGCKPRTRIPINSSGTSYGGAISFARKCVMEIADIASWDA